MERQPLPPASGPVAPARPASSPEKGVFERWRKKREAHAASEPAKPEAQPPQPQPEAAVKQSMGKNILRLLFAKNSRPEAAPTAPPQTPEAQAAAPELAQAQRVRRFARLVMAHVFGEVKAEPSRAQSAGETPLNTANLAGAAEDLQTATAELTETITEAKEGGLLIVPRHESGSGYDSGEAPRPFADYHAAELITERLHKLESNAESSRAANVAAVGLGILAVIITGHEYLARKRAVKALKTEQTQSRKAVGALQREIAVQKQAFAALRQEQPVAQNRADRQQYYKQLGDFTHQQADTTREAARELQEVMAPAEQLSLPHTEWQPRQPTGERPSAPEKPAPIVRVEQSDTIERGSSRRTDAPGTIGGGFAGDPGHTEHMAKAAQQTPLSPAALRAEAERKARAARLASNAWLYGAALALAGAFIVTIIILG